MRGRRKGGAPAPPHRAPQGIAAHVAAFSRDDLEAYQHFLHRHRSPRGGKPLAVNTRLARLARLARLCRSGTIPANPAADFDLPRKQARRLPKSLSTKAKSGVCWPNPADSFGLRDHSPLPCRKLRMACRGGPLIPAAI